LAGESESVTGGYNPEIHDFPGIEEGIRGMTFIDTVVKSNKAGAVWMKVEEK
jgi:hypothetical protein